MRTRAAAMTLWFLASGLLPALPAAAQYAARGTASTRATGETYHVEVSGNFWNPSPDLFIRSDSIPGIPGDRIDFVKDLGAENTQVRQLKVVLRPAKKHKFLFEYSPIKYEQSGTINRDLVFNGIEFPISLPVESTLKWTSYRFGYEWDFLYYDRGFVGLVLEAKYTDVEATLTNIIDNEFVRARAPLPAIGVIGRGYILRNLSITGQFNAFKLPDIDEDYEGRYYEFDVYGTYNFTNNFGAQFGYRSFDVNFKIVENNLVDEGAMVLKGFYFGGAARF